MKVYALSDLHLSTSIPEKSMEKFGLHWKNHDTKIRQNWNDIVRDEDLIIIAGDISWAMHLQNAISDLNFLATLKGIKVMIRGNHDYWWQSISKVKNALPDKVNAIQNDAILIENTLLCGTRLWNVHNISYNNIINLDMDLNHNDSNEDIDNNKSRKIFDRELCRLKLSLDNLKKLESNQESCLKIAITHFPPCDVNLNENEITELFSKYGINHVIFGHLHNIKKNLEKAPFGNLKGIYYHLTSCDYLDFKPKLICELRID